MATDTFKPGNRFSDVVSVAAAAVEWQGLSREEQDLVVVEDGIPFLAGVPDLTDRAEAIAEAAERRAIVGLTHTEDGNPLPVARMRLYRDSVDAWVAKSRRRLPPELPRQPAGSPPPDELLRVSEVTTRLGIKRSTLYRWLESGKLDRAHAQDPPRWRASYIEALVAGQSPEVDEDT